ASPGRRRLEHMCGQIGLTGAAGQPGLRPRKPTRGIRGAVYCGWVPPVGVKRRGTQRWLPLWSWRGARPPVPCPPGDAPGGAPAGQGEWAFLSHDEALRYEDDRGRSPVGRRAKGDVNVVPLSEAGGDVQAELLAFRRVEGRRIGEDGVEAASEVLRNA